MNGLIGWWMEVWADNEFTLHSNTGTIKSFVMSFWLKILKIYSGPNIAHLLRV